MSFCFDDLLSCQEGGPASGFRHIPGHRGHGLGPGRCTPSLQIIKGSGLALERAREGVLDRGQGEQKRCAIGKRGPKKKKGERLRREMRPRAQTKGSLEGRKRMRIEQSDAGDATGDDGVDRGMGGRRRKVV